jgi:hypothetical protein
LTRAELDGRTNAAKIFDRLVVDIENDLGGREVLSTIERSLIEAFAGAALTLHHLNAQLALGEPIDFSEHAQAVSAMVRIASRLGLQRRAKDIGGLTLGDLHRLDQEDQRLAAEAAEAAAESVDASVDASGVDIAADELNVPAAAPEAV